MKLLYISIPSFADCDFPLIKSLQDKGYDITYLIYLDQYHLSSTLFNIKQQKTEADIIPATAYKELKVYERYLDLTKIYIINSPYKRKSDIRNLRLIGKVLKFINKNKFDIIHGDEIFSFHECLYYIYHKKLVMTIHDPFPHSGEISFRKSLFRNLSFKFASRLILLNQKQKSSFIQKYKIDPKKIFINKLGIYDTIHLFNNKTSTLNIENNQLNILFLGRISPYKGIEFLCEAMKKVRNEIPNSNLIIAGKGKLYFDFKPYNKYPYIQLKNEYISLEDMYTLLSHCHIVVCPYIDATQSGVVMTAYSMLKPVIVTNVGGLPEMCKDGITGYIVPPKDSNALANAIINLLKDPNKLSLFSNNIREEYLKGDSSWNSIANQYIECYKEILKK